MSQFSYEEYERQQAAKRANAANSGGKTNNVQFINSFLKNDGDTVVVRFPYASMKDIVYETTHNVRFPGDKWDKRVRCVGENCPLCANGVKQDTRFFVKALVYQIDDDTAKMKVMPAIWDRAAAFADIDIKGKMQQCAEDDIGPLCDNLVKIRKTGTGLETRYSLDIVSASNKTYNNNTCPASFELLDDVDATKILTKSFEQYKTALNGGAEAAVAKKEEVPTEKVQPKSEPATYAAPVTQAPVVETPQAPVESTKPEAVNAEPEVRRQVRFQF